MKGLRKFGRDLTNLPRSHDSLSKSTHSMVMKPTKKDTDAIGDYTRDIIEFLFQTDRKEKMDVQGPEGSQVTDKMRQILIDWLVDVHQAFELREETLHLAVLYLDHYQSVKPINKEDYQLLGVTCLWIASKYEEIYPPRMKKYTEVTAFTYNGSQLKQMEGNILNVIDFNLTKITSLALLNANQQGLPEKNVALVKFLLELSLLNGRIATKYGHRMLLAAGVRLSDAICGGVTNCSEISQGLDEGELQTCYKELCLLLKIENRYKLTSIRRKFSKERYLGVGKIRLEL